MTETGWQAIGRIARLRRERLGLKQEDLALYGGPKVSTVGKFERAAQDSFPMRTQHQMENALGWGRTIVEQVVKSIDAGELTAEDWEHDLVEEDVPDLSRPFDPTGPAIDQFDAHTLALKALLATVPPERREEAFTRAVTALLRMVPTSMRGDLSPDDNVAQLPMSEPVDRTDTSIAADEGESPIERGQGHDEHP